MSRCMHRLSITNTAVLLAYTLYGPIMTEKLTAALFVGFWLAFAPTYVTDIVTSY